MSHVQTQRVDTPDGISWHVEIFNEGQTNPKYLVLIPSGEGDCDSLTAIATLLSSKPYEYTVITFDMPGFSRTTAPEAATKHVTPQLLSEQIVGLLDALKIDRAAFFGSSSGGLATLALAALHPSRVRCGIVHEPPMCRYPTMSDLLQKSDEEIVAALQFVFGNVMIEQDRNDGPAKWAALGPDYHARLNGNYTKFVRGYANAVEDGAMELFVGHPENLRRRPTFWTVGGLQEGVEGGEGPFKATFEVARAAGVTINVRRLMCLHFPHVTVPEETAGWIDECIRQVE